MASTLTFKKDMAFTYGEPSDMVPGVRRIVANNGGPLTFHGTNTYLVGTNALAVIDPGPDDAAHRDAIERAAAGKPITHIFITHRHRDHVDGTLALKMVTGAKTCAFDGRRSLRGMAVNTPTGRSFIDLDFVPDQDIKNGDVIEGEDWQLKAVHTPGHAPDHLCFALEAENILFSGDHVMSWNTSVIAPPEGSMAEYVTSLEKLLERTDALFLPGHGGRLENPRRVVRAYLLHRKLREQAILDAIRNGNSTIKSLASEIYSGVPQSVAGAAALSVLAHVELLHARGLVTCAPKLALDAEIYPV